MSILANEVVSLVLANLLKLDGVFLKGMTKEKLLQKLASVDADAVDADAVDADDADAVDDESEQEIKLKSTPKKSAPKVEKKSVEKKATEKKITEKKTTEKKTTEKKSAEKEDLPAGFDAKKRDNLKKAISKTSPGKYVNVASSKSIQESATNKKKFVFDKKAKIAVPKIEDTEEMRAYIDAIKAMLK